MTCLLDSPALPAFFFGEPGGERVRTILSDEAADVRISVLTMAEFWSRLRASPAPLLLQDHLTGN